LSSGVVSAAGGWLGATRSSDFGEDTDFTVDRWRSPDRSGTRRNAPLVDFSAESRDHGNETTSIPSFRHGSRTPLTVRRAKLV
jgi:hypothetical protein